MSNLLDLSGLITDKTIFTVKDSVASKDVELYGYSTKIVSSTTKTINGSDIEVMSDVMFFMRTPSKVESGKTIEIDPVDWKYRISLKKDESGLSTGDAYNWLQLK